MPNYTPSTEQSCGSEHDQEYTIFVEAAMKRRLTDHQGPGQETARAIIPSQAEVEGNEVAD